MKCNMGYADRIIRTLIAATILVLYLTGVLDGVFGIVLLVLALVFLITSIIGFCPLYMPLKLNTNKKKLTGE